MSAQLTSYRTEATGALPTILLFLALLLTALGVIAHAAFV